MSCHGFGLFEPHQVEDRRRYVGQDTVADRFHAVGNHADRDRIARMGRIGRAVGIDRIVGVAVIGDLHDLHLQLMKLPVGAHYRQTYAKLEPELPRLRAVLGNPGMNDTELCFRALYAAMLYRIRGEGGQQAVADTVEYISPAIAELASMYGKVERGEIDLFEREK